MGLMTLDWWWAGEHILDDLRKTAYSLGFSSSASRPFSPLEHTRGLRYFAFPKTQKVGSPQNSQAPHAASHHRRRAWLISAAHKDKQVYAKDLPDNYWGLEGDSRWEIWWGQVMRGPGQVWGAPAHTPTLRSSSGNAALRHGSMQALGRPVFLCAELSLFVQRRRSEICKTVFLGQNSYIPCRNSTILAFCEIKLKRLLQYLPSIWF